MKKGAHLTAPPAPPVEGLEEIKKIKERINQGRK
jgi:hypothetical protein